MADMESVPVLLELFDSDTQYVQNDNSDRGEKWYQWVSAAMHKPTLSIIMPVYNRKSDLKVTLEALSEISCEVIVIDDGSINVTNCDIVKEYE